MLAAMETAPLELPDWEGAGVVPVLEAGGAVEEGAGVEEPVLEAGVDEGVEDPGAEDEGEEAVEDPAGLEVKVTPTVSQNWRAVASAEAASSALQLLTMHLVVPSMKLGLRHKHPRSFWSHVPISALARQGLAQSGYCLRPRVAAEAEAARAATMKAARMMIRLKTESCRRRRSKDEDEKAESATREGERARGRK